jgi:LytS/YehU family sensor histidine kinase
VKHPVLENRIRVVVWWLAWLFLAAGQALSYYFAYGSFVIFSIVDPLLSLLIYSALALSLWYPFAIINKGDSKILTRIMNLVLTGAISIAIWVLLSKLLIPLVLPGQENFDAYWTATFYYRIGSGVFIFFLVILTYYLFVSLTNLSEKQSREAKLESLVKETELKMLRSQINPHFLFNSLNSVSSLTITDPEKARDMVIKLSDFMRYALSKKDEQPVTLRSELENLRLYLEIEKVRFGERLTTDEQIEEGCLEVKMPVMILQPLYENAIKHGVYESTESVRIATIVRLIDNFMEITISNNYDTVSEPRKGTGTGLVNVIRRLELFYGNKATLKTSRENSIYTVSLYIPANCN